MKRILCAPLLALILAGCQPLRPPTPEGLKRIQARTAQGTVNTKLEARSQPEPAKAGNVSIWDLKIFDIKDQKNGMRQEWKNFAQLPQQPGTGINNTLVLMNAWLISPDRTIFLPQKPAAKAYGSFVTDWTIPRPGSYELWVEYQPTVAQEELSMQEVLTRKASYKLPREVAHWNFVATGESLEGAPAAAKVAAPRAAPFPVYDAKGARTSDLVTLVPIAARAGRPLILKWALANQAKLENPEIVAIAPDNSTLLHGIGTAPTLTFTKAGIWRVWFNYTRDEQSFAAPFVLEVAP